MLERLRGWLLLKMLLGRLLHSVTVVHLRAAAAPCSLGWAQG